MHTKMNTLLILFLILLSNLSASDDFWGVHGRVDLAPIYMRVQVIESGETTNTLDMGGGRIEATILPFDGYGICIRPLLFGAGGEGTFYSGGCGIGHYTPITECWALIPTVGVSYTHLHTRIDLPLPGFVLKDVKEIFRSNNFYLGMDVCFHPTPSWNVTYVFQYVWARTRTTIEPFPDSKGRTQGTNWGIVADYFWRENWTITVAGGYNNSLSKEKHGIRGYGFKAGVAWVF